MSPCGHPTIQQQTNGTRLCSSCGEPVSERDELVQALSEHACCFTPDEAEAMVDAFAREVAEKGRAS